MLAIALVITSALAFTAVPDELSPQAEKMEPRAGKPGTILVISGVSLEKGKVEEVYLTDHRFDVKVKILEQSGNKLKVRIPPFVKPGRQQLLFLTAGKDPVYLEQPIWVQVEDAADEKEIVAQKEKESGSKETGAGDGNKPDKPEDKPE